MNSSPFLPPEIMITFSNEWLHRCQCNPSCTQNSSLEWSKGAGNTSHRSGPEQQQQLDHFADWQFSSCSSMNVHRSFDDRGAEPPAHVPDLSHTPLSCDSSTSGSASLPFDSFARDHFTYYAPDLDSLCSREFDLSVSSYPPPEFSIPSFPTLHSPDNESRIHSPKPIFGYKTFKFDFDRPHSPDAPVAVSRLKRNRDSENGFQDMVLPPKRRKMSDDAPGIFSLFPNPYRGVPSGWDSCSPVDQSYPDNNFSMGQLLNCTVDWTNNTWPKLPVC